MSKIEINHLTVDYVEKKKSFTALRDVSFKIEEGEFVSIIGSSGCGKSTLLSILEGINSPTEGEILIDGEDETTGIVALEDKASAQKNDKIYTLDGRQVTDFETLPSGIYIVNGKKMYKK